jgi:anthranilate phosphoribosyltransferase
MKEIMNKIVERQDLSQTEAQQTMESIMTGNATPAQVGAFITALRMKGETVDEITGCAQAMRTAAATIDVGAAQDVVVDTCGTGGDRSNTFNISSAVAVVAAAAGLKVAKHGNRSVSSKSGSADVLETLGVQIALPPEKVKACIDQIGIGFMFAPNFHPAMKYAGPARKEIGIRTIFNILGPLSNPANANVQILGVYAAELTEVMANVLAKLGVKRAFVVHGNDHLDEFSITGPTQVSEVGEDGKVKNFTVTPDDFGLETAKLKDLQGGDATVNAGILNNVFGNESGAKLDAVLMNTSAVLVAAGKAKDFKAGVEQAREVIASGKAKAKLEEWVKVSKKLAE